jgi:aminoglycoside phosphotransferase (APT) family kinase protein
MVVMRDISNDVEFCGHDTGISWGAACAQMDTLVGLHSRYLGSDDALRATNLIHWPKFFANVVRQGQQYSSAMGFLAAEHVIPRRLFLRKEEVWTATVRSVEHHRTLPQTVIHGDCHLKQWFKRPSGGMGVTDWQCATIGNWSRDLSYVVATSLSLDSRRAWEKELLRYYIDAMNSAGADMPSFDHVWLLYRQNMMSALNWWTGTLVPAPGMPEMQPRFTTMEFIAKLAAAVDDLDSIDSCSQPV